MRTLGAALLLACSLPVTLRADVLEGPVARAVRGAFVVHQVARDQDPLLGHPRDAELQRLAAERRERERDARDQLNLATAVFIGSAGADWAVTAACFKVQCTDGPGHHASFFVGGPGFRNVGAAAALGLGLDAAIVLVARSVIAPDHPKLARGVLWVASGVRVVILTNKVNDLRAHAHRSPLP